MVARPSPDLSHFAEAGLAVIGVGVQLPGVHDLRLVVLQEFVLEDFVPLLQTLRSHPLEKSSSFVGTFMYTRLLRLSMSISSTLLSYETESKLTE